MSDWEMTLLLLAATLFCVLMEIRHQRRHKHHDHKEHK